MRPRYITEQEQSLDWLARTHAQSQARQERLTAVEQEAFRAQLRKVMERCACGARQIARRGHVVSDLDGGGDAFAMYDAGHGPQGAPMSARMAAYRAVVTDAFQALYPETATPPRDLLHVSCTGYFSPSGAQELVARRDWGQTTRVTHAYHMGCYASLPAVRMAAGCLSLPAGLVSGESASEARVDIVHTELCSLHLDPSQHSIEQLVVQSLFADGIIRYSLSASPGPKGPGLEVLALDEAILPDSTDAMTWGISEFGMRMTLSRDVPERIAGALRGFVERLHRRAGLSLAQELKGAVFAVHPGGPKIIDRVQTVLELRDEQVAASRGVLRDHGNMSSATLPHVWMRLVDDPAVAPGTNVVSLAFGPGLTVCGGLFRKR